MRGLLRALALTLVFCGAAAQAGEAVNLAGRCTGVFQYPKTETVCLSFETTDKKPYMICDDVTAKEIIEQLPYRRLRGEKVRRGNLPQRHPRDRGQLAPAGTFTTPIPFHAA